MKLAVVLVSLFGFISCAGSNYELVVLPGDLSCQANYDELSLDLHALEELSSSSLQCLLKRVRASTGQIQDLQLGTTVCFLLADQCKDTQIKSSYAKEGMNFAEAAITASSTPQGWMHYYFALNLGLLMEENLLEAMSHVSTMQNHLEKAMALSADIDDGGPLRLLGMLYYQAPAWPRSIGDGDRALELLEQAAQEYPQHPLNHLFLAEVAYNMDEDQEKVRKHLELYENLISQPLWQQHAQRWNQIFDKLKKDVPTQDMLN